MIDKICPNVESEVVKATMQEICAAISGDVMDVLPQRNITDHEHIMDETIICRTLNNVLKMLESAKEAISRAG